MLFSFSVMQWSHGFYLTHVHGQNGFEFFCKTKDLKKKWLEQFGMALSNIHPENANSNNHAFIMHSFDQITYCQVCRMLLRGVFYQGYMCPRCGTGAHKECLGRLGICGKSTAGLPKMQVLRRYNGCPQPPAYAGPALHIRLGDIIQVVRAEAHYTWWEVGTSNYSRESSSYP
ncbi:guanine nucleotide exchange factor VAV3-like isoform X2 [Scyliorhinus canicula]|uniref:guanine nucleotide exchange factor VAV3-like isoform X2 n=1 Tax=Scyliorhinus canicula TaxID=7830 RepID=UPI0018F41812|nr:guanine nucleotide exchange factor VAV3-like isoform X2 [Scyliorhinus canicula]